MAEGVFTVPGDGGGVDVATAIGALEQAGHAGWLVVEAAQDPAKAPPLTDARTGYRNLSRRVGDAVNSLRFTTNSNFLGCSMGRSAGLAPFRTLST